MDEPAAPTPAPAPVTRPALPTALLAIAIIDLVWAASALALDFVVLVVGGASIYFASYPVHASEALHGANFQLLAIGGGALVSAIVNVCLLSCGIDILRRRASARRWQNFWIAGVALLVAFDVVVFVATWHAPWSLCGVPFLLATPAWAAFHAHVLRRPSSAAAFAPVVDSPASAS